MSHEAGRKAKVLLIRFGSLGDVVLVGAVIEALARDRPDVDVRLLVKARYAPLFRDDPRVARVIALEDGGGVWGLLRLARSLRGERFGAVVDLHASLRSRLLGLLLGPVRITRTRKRHWARWAVVHAPWLGVRVPRTVEAYLDALAPLGVVSRCEPRLYVDAGAAREAQAFLADAGLRPAQTLVGVHPGSRWPAKRWTSHGFAAVIEALSERPGLRVMVLGDQTDRPFVDQVVAHLGRRPIVAVGELKLTRLVALTDRCAVFLANDSGPMHIAAALGVPTVGLFGPTHPKLGFAPQGAHSKVLSVNAPCSPCSLHGSAPCKKARRACMEDLSPARVLEAIEPLIPGLPARAGPGAPTV